MLSCNWEPLNYCKQMNEIIIFDPSKECLVLVLQEKLIKGKLKVKLLALGMKRRGAKLEICQV